ncbi:hypothetical protein JST97_20450 [bacterium]|nr:hypothetical protein [bacterium]
MQVQSNPIFKRPGLTLNKPNQPEEPKKGGDFNEKDFSWLDLGKGLVGSVAGGAIVGTGAAVAGTLKAPRIAFEAVRGLWKSKMLGPVLKATLTPVVIAAGVVAPVFVAIGGLGYGMFDGFVEGSSKNPWAAVTKSVDTCKQMHGKVTKQIVEGIRDMASKEPNSPEEIYEIKVVEAGQGLVSSVASAAIDGVGVGGSVLLNTPKAYFNVSKALWKSEAALPLKVGGQFLATAGLVLAAPLGVVGGALYGLGKGAYNGYTEGVLGGVKAAGQDVAEFHKAASKAVDHID